MQFNLNVESHIFSLLEGLQTFLIIIGKVLAPEMAVSKYWQLIGVTNKGSKNNNYFSNFNFLPNSTSKN